jgi:hypothetical protein
MNNQIVQAIQLIKDGRKAEARLLLQNTIKMDRANEEAWLVYAASLDTHAEQAKALQLCLRFNPGAEKARAALLSLEMDSQQPESKGAVEIPTSSPAKDQLLSNPQEPLPGETDHMVEEGAAIFTVPPEEVSPEEYEEAARRAEANLANKQEIRPLKIQKERRRKARLANNPAGRGSANEGSKKARPADRGALILYIAAAALGVLGIGVVVIGLILTLRGGF